MKTINICLNIGFSTVINVACKNNICGKYLKERQQTQWYEPKVSNKRYWEILHYIIGQLQIGFVSVSLY